MAEWRWYSGSDSGTERVSLDWVFGLRTPSHPFEGAERGKKVVGHFYHQCLTVSRDRRLLLGEEKQ